MTNDVKRRMIEEAAKSLARRGLQGTSFSEVLAASGAPRGSLYHHFPGGKDELVLAAIDAASERALTGLGDGEGRSAVEVAEAFVGLWRYILVRTEFSMGCAIVAVTVASNEPNHLSRAGEIFSFWRMRLGERLASGGVPSARAAPLAALLIAACEGAVILARAEKSLAPFEAAAAEALAAVRIAMTSNSSG